jgi:diphosphomevalonate decarboxylase
MLFSNPRLLLTSSEIKPDKVTWRSPSNLAIIKYWGKRNNQIPENPSISLTLSESWSETSIIYSQKSYNNSRISLSFSFEGNSDHIFGDRVRSYFEKILPIFPFLNQLHFDIHSRNSFPHSSGIASSASGMSALALCLCSIEDRLFETLDDESVFRQKASFIARLGSGSACRSIYNRAALWGLTGVVSNSSDEYAIPLEEYLHPRIKDLCDSILITESGKKEISSTKGHEMMEMHPFAKARYTQAKKHIQELFQVMQNGDIKRFGILAEMEALILHSLMLSSGKGYFLINPNTLNILRLVRQFRKSTDYPLFFSLDAGPNVHLLYPKEYKEIIESFILDVLIDYCEEGKWIADMVGPGPERIE